MEISSNLQGKSQLDWLRHTLAQFYVPIAFEWPIIHLLDSADFSFIKEVMLIYTHRTAGPRHVIPLSTVC